MSSKSFNIHRVKADGSNKEKVKELDKKYDAGIYKGTRDSAYWFDRIGHELFKHFQTGNGNQIGETGSGPGDMDL